MKMAVSLLFWEFSTDFRYAYKSPFRLFLGVSNNLTILYYNCYVY